MIQMMLCNHTSRFDVAIAAIRGGAARNSKVALIAHEAESYIKHMAKKEKDYIYKHGKGVLWFCLLDPGTDGCIDHDYISETPTFEGR